MYIGLITPAPPRSRYGNRVTAVRWSRILRELGHRVTIRGSFGGENFDLLIALHALRSFDSINRFHQIHPDKPVVVALTGTDLYRDLGESRNAQQSLDLAARIVVLQRLALEKLNNRWRGKTRVIHQSVSWPLRTNSRRSNRQFDVCVVGHLRPVKDPFRAAMAARLLPETSRIQITQVGRAMDNKAEQRARREMSVNHRYKWLGEVSPRTVSRILSRSHLFVISSKIEGGANALGEAIAVGLPVIATRIPGSIGILGDDYPGYFEVGDTSGLARLLLRCESEPNFLRQITRRCNKVAPFFAPSRERRAWEALIAELLEDSNHYH